MTNRKAKPTPPEPKPPERPEGYRQTLHLSCKTIDLQDLDTLADLIRKHPIHGRLHSNVGREKAALFAVATLVRLPVEKWPS